MFLMDDNRKKAVDYILALPEAKLDYALMFLEALSEDEPAGRGASGDDAGGARDDEVLNYSDFEFVSADEAMKSGGVVFDKM